MSYRTPQRHDQIKAQLQLLVHLDVLSDWQLSRPDGAARWELSSRRGLHNYLSTREVEAFIAGAFTYQAATVGRGPDVLTLSDSSLIGD